MSDLASRIKFQGQKISLSRAEALHEVTWANPLTDRLRFFRRFSGIEGIVESIEVIAVFTILLVNAAHSKRDSF